MTSIREPRAINAATVLAERYTKLGEEIDLIQASRNEIIAAANTNADKMLDPLIAERDTIETKMAAWWGKGGREQALGEKPKAKSVELGGCLLGEKKGKASLLVPEDEDSLIERMRSSRALKELLRVKESIDKAAVLKELAGKKAAALKELGFGRTEGVEQFFIKRAEQGQTRA